MPALPDPRSEALVVIGPDGAVTAYEPDDVLVVDTELQPFGASGARRLDVDDRRLLVPNIRGRAVIVDLTGATPFAVPAPLVSDPEAARRIDLGHRYVACGRLRPGLTLLTSCGGDDEIA